MANIYRNIFARGMAGAFGERSFSYKTHSGKTIVMSEPLFDDYREYLDSLEQHQAAMLEASTYASFVQMQELYLQKELETGMNAYSLAIADWFSAPRILQIDVDRWTGKAGETIRVKARDNVSVVRVALVIRDAAGNVLEMGEAIQTETDSRWWHYVTRSQISLQPFPQMQAIAQDLPGNSAFFTVP